MQAEVNIAPEIMNWIEQHMKAGRINSSMLENFQHWKSGEKKPTFNQVETFSRVTNIPLGYFFLRTPPTEDLSLLAYRTIDSYELQNPSRNLIDTIHDMENVQEWMRDYLVASDNAMLNFVGSQRDNRNPQEIAELMRKNLKLTIDWYNQSKNAWDSFKKIREKAEILGILIMMNGIVGSNTHRKLEIEEFRAFTLIDRYAPLIFINSNDSQNGKLFSLLHEMAHVWLGKDNFFNDRYSAATSVNDTEILCNAIAAEFLVPQSLFVQKWREQLDKTDFEEKVISVASYFKCGTTVIARKALINKYIDMPQYNKIAQDAVIYFNKIQEEKKDDESGGDFYKTMTTRIDGRFLNAIANSIQEGRTLYSDAFRLTHTNRNTFAALLEKVRGEKP
jgi:Zn-dependent peptidase ImmA (M78 family)